MTHFNWVNLVVGTTATRLYIIGGVAVVSQIYNNQGVLQSTKENYLHHDHLGSLSMITNASGFVVKDFYYDLWGASRARNNNITHQQSRLYGPRTSGF